MTTRSHILKCQGYSFYITSVSAALQNIPALSIQSFKTTLPAVYFLRNVAGIFQLTCIVVSCLYAFDKKKIKTHIFTYDFSEGRYTPTTVSLYA